MICHYHNQYVVWLLFGESWLKRVPYFVFIIFAQLTPAGLIKPDGSVQLLMPFIDASAKYTYTTLFRKSAFTYLQCLWRSN
jgi:hypothetical protein